MVEASQRVKEAEISLSVTVILGLGGMEKSVEHALDTARILTDIDPDYAGALTLMLVPKTPLYHDYMAGRFVLPDKFGFIRELYLIIANSTFTNCFSPPIMPPTIYRSRLVCRREKEKILKMIGSIIETGDLSKIRPEYLRGL